MLQGNQVKLPVGYELDNVNWISTFFDYLATDPAQTVGGGIAFELEYLIPDTIIIKQRRPYAWLTANKSQIMRKDKIDELQPKLIFEGLCAAYRRKDVLQPHTVLAYLLVTKPASVDNPMPTPTIEYFNMSSLQTYLFVRLRTDDRAGILQLFIPPPGNCNALIRAWWTPVFALTDRERETKTHTHTHTHTHNHSLVVDAGLSLSLSLSHCLSPYLTALRLLFERVQSTANTPLWTSLASEHPEACVLDRVPVCVCVCACVYAYP